MRILLILFLAFSTGLSPASVGEERPGFSAQSALTMIKDLAADSMEGRESGERGGRLAAEYISSRFKEWGLASILPNGSYIQDFRGEHMKARAGAKLRIQAGHASRDFDIGEDWSVWQYSGSGDFTAEIVFAGYGLQAPQKGYDDYAGIDVKGKLVFMALGGGPAGLAESAGNETDLQQRIQAARRLGARGVMLFVNPGQRIIAQSLKKDVYRNDFVILWVNDQVLHSLFKDLKAELSDLLQKIDISLKPMSFATGAQATVSVHATFDEMSPMSNVLAVIPGQDPELRNEVVVIGAHMDHLGIEPNGEVMNGADDNASGTAVVMEMARVMASKKARPNRTVVFALWAAEEQHLLGSKHYLEHPPLPLEKTLAYLNFDMVGQGGNKLNVENIYYCPEIWGILAKKLPKDINSSINPIRESVSGTSDYDSFLEKGIPALAVMSDGHHLKYHQSRDDADLIDPSILQKTGDFGLAAVEILANEPGIRILADRQEAFYLKQVSLTDFDFLPLNEAIEKAKDVRDPLIDLQLAVVEEKEDLSGDALRIDLIKRLLSAEERARGSRGSIFFSSPKAFRQEVYREGKTTILPGLKGLRSLQGAPEWVEVLANQGLFFIVLDDVDTDLLFDRNELGPAGKVLLDALNKSGLLPILNKLPDPRSEVILNSVQQPVLILARDLPARKVMELIKRTHSVLGLVLSREEDPADFIKKMDAARRDLGTEHLQLVNESPLWEDKGQRQIMNVISEFLRINAEWSDIVRPFSRAFLRALEESRE
jgi:aminopeptidase YwaD